MEPMTTNGKTVRWMVAGKLRGYGSINKDGTFTLSKCPKQDCGLENYAMNVLLGVCTWCGFDANEAKE